MIGDEILVAPVLTPGQRRRDVYLPQPEEEGTNVTSVWRRGSDGKLFKGGGWRRDMEVRYEENGIVYDIGTHTTFDTIYFL